MTIEMSRGRGVRRMRGLLFVCALLLLSTGCASDNQQTVVAQDTGAVPMPPTDLYAGSPYLRELRNDLVYGEIWERPQLSKRDRSLITIAVLQALAREELGIHIPRGLDNGLTPEEISEIILQQFITIKLIHGLIWLKFRKIQNQHTYC